MQRTPTVLAGVAVLGLAAVVGAVLRAGPAAADDVTTLRGVARGADGPAADAEVAIGILGFAPRAGDHVVVAKADAEGRFALDRAPLGPVDVWVRPKGGAWSFAIRMAHPGVNDLDVDARPKAGFGGFGGFGDDGGDLTVTGVVTDKAAKPVAGAAVGLRGDDTTWVLTDAKGQFTLEKAAKGDGLIVRANGFRDSLGEVKGGGKRLTIALAPVKPTVVHVSDPDGKPLEGAWVVLGDPERVHGTTGMTSMFPPRERLVGGWTDAKGDARIAWGDPEDATVATAYAVRFAPAHAKVTAGKAVVNLKLAAARPARATAVLRGEPLAGALLGMPRKGEEKDHISALPAEQERGPVVVGRTDAKRECLIPHLDEAVTELWAAGENRRHADVTIERVAAGDAK